MSQHTGDVSCSEHRGISRNDRQRFLLVDNNTSFCFVLSLNAEASQQKSLFIVVYTGSGR